MFFRKNRIAECKNMLKEAYNNGFSVDFNLIHGYELELDKLLEEEEIYWKQRSREDWLKHGDKNTKWFHKKSNHEKKTK